jgi:hypothetical protein
MRQDGYAAIRYNGRLGLTKPSVKPTVFAVKP